jgi:hypothetical protein
MTAFGLLFGGVLAVMLASPAKKQPVPLRNAEAFTESCLAVAEAAKVVFERFGFRSNGGDSDGETYTVFYWKRRGSTWPAATSDVKKVTAGRVGFFDVYYEFVITSAAFEVRPKWAGGCTGTARLTYAGYKRGIVMEGWYELDSNNAYEHAILDGIAAELKNSSKIQ